MEEATAQKSTGYGKRPMWQWIVLYLIVAVIVYGFIYYFVLAKNGSNYSSQTPSQTTNTNVGSLSPITVTVVGKEFSFTPSVITVKQGQQITIIFKNMGTYPHNLTIIGVNQQTKTIQPSQQDTISFTPAKSGVFTFECTVPGHADRGMKGTFVVQ